jgi:hypothetical protein
MKIRSLPPVPSEADGSHREHPDPDEKHARHAIRHPELGLQALSPIQQDFRRTGWNSEVRILCDHYEDSTHPELGRRAPWIRLASHSPGALSPEHQPALELLLSSSAGTSLIRRLKVSFRFLPSTRYGVSRCRKILPAGKDSTVA